MADRGSATHVLSNWPAELRSYLGATATEQPQYWNPVEPLPDEESVVVLGSNTWEPVIHARHRQVTVLGEIGRRRFDEQVSRHSGLPRLTSTAIERFSQVVRLLPKIGLAVLTTLVAFGACELAARAFFPAPSDPDRQPQVLYQYDPDVGYTHVPNQTGWIDAGIVTINSLGFRGPDVVLPKPPGRTRIVVIGDSLTLGMGVREDETYCSSSSSGFAPRTHGAISTSSISAFPGTTSARGRAAHTLRGAPATPTSCWSASTSTTSQARDGCACKRGRCHNRGGSAQAGSDTANESAAVLIVADVDAQEPRRLPRRARGNQNDGGRGVEHEAVRDRPGLARRTFLVAT